MNRVPSPIVDVLQPDEAVLWWGRPDSWRYVVGGLTVTLPLGVMALASAATWAWGARWQEIPTWAVAVLVMVVLFDLHMLVARPLLSLGQARSTLYAVTDRRALVVCGSRRRVVQQLSHEAGELLVTEGIGGPSRVQFGRSAASSWQVVVLGRAAIPGFYGLHDLAPALDQLSRQRERAHSG